MSWLTIAWSMTAAACLTLAAIYGLVWLQTRRGWCNLMFAVVALMVAALAAIELVAMETSVPRTYAAWIRWGHVPTFALIASLVLFVRLYLNAGRPWLAWTAVGLRLLSLAVNFLTGENLNFIAVHSMQSVPFLGQTVFIPQGAANPWMILGSLSLLLFLLFMADAAVMVWQRGDRRRALTICGSVFVSVLLPGMNVVFVVQGVYSAPILVSPAFLGFIVGMSLELSRDLAAVAELARRLQVSEATIRQSEQRMSLAAEAARLAHWSWDIPRDVIWVSSEGRELYGVSPNDPITFDRFLATLHPEDRDRTQAAAEQSLRSDGQFRADYRVKLSDGNVRWIAATGRVDFDPDHRPLRMRGVSLDVTDRRRAELEAQEHRNNLTHAGRVSLLGQLASALAHELSQPLGAILRNAETAELMLQTPSPDLEELRAIVADIRADDQRAGRIIDRLRSLLKRRSVEMQPLDLAEVIGEVLALLHADAVARHVTLVYSPSPELPLVRGDRIHLQQVLLNLLVNGMDALADPTLKHRSIHVTAHAAASPGLVEVQVRDHGPGLAGGSVERVFEPFFTTKTNGLGLGLSVSRTIIEAHQGKIWANNPPEGGACFHFTLPAASGEGLVTSGKERSGE